MNVIRYSPWKLIGLALITAVPAALFMWMLVVPDTFLAFHGRSSFWVHLIADNFWVAGGLFMVTGGVSALALSLAFGDRTALAIGGGGIEVRTIYRQHSLGWAEVAGIGIAEASRAARRAETLIIRVRRDGDEKLLRIATSLLEQSRPEIERILEAAGRSDAASVRAPRIAAAPAIQHDVAIAGRQGGPGAPSAARGGFGRKGL